MKTIAVCAAFILAIFTGCVTHPCPKDAEIESSQTIPDSLTSPGGKFGLLPSVVQRTVLAYGGASEIKDISKANTDRDVYVIQFRDPITNPTLFILDDGTPAYSLNPFFPSSAAKLSVMMPPAVRSALERQVPDAVVTRVQPAQMKLYEVSFANGQEHPPLLILEDGTVLPAPDTGVKHSSLH